MSTTPEAKIKNAVRKVLDEFPPIYTFWPVPGGYGPSSLDCLVCYYGVFIGIETKAPSKKPTPRQEFTIDQIEKAGGPVFVIDSVEGAKNLRIFLLKLRTAKCMLANVQRSPKLD